MNEIYSCKNCDKKYKSYMGLWLHNKKYHTEEIMTTTIKTKTNPNICKYCNKELSCKQSRWKHEQKCKSNKHQYKILEDKVNELSQKIKNLEENPRTITNNTTNNIQYIINSPTSSSIEHLTFDLQKDILDKGLNSLVYLIELINFNKSVPKNHSYCVTAINDKHASVIDEKTNTIIKTNKFDLFDKVLGANLDNLEKISNNPKFTMNQRNDYKDKINYLKTMMIQNNKFIKRYQNDINIISYNNKDMVKETWNSLKHNLNQKDTFIKSIDKEELEHYKDKPLGFDDLIEELSNNEK